MSLPSFILEISKYKNKNKIWSKFGKDFAYLKYKKNNLDISFYNFFNNKLCIIGNPIINNKISNKHFVFSFINNKILVVPNGLTKDLHITNDTKELPTDGRPLRILYLSNLIPSKGYLTLLEACMKLVKENKIEFICDFCGAFTQTIVDGNNLNAKERKKEFQNLIRENNLIGRVFYHETVSGKAKEEILSQAHLFVLPTCFPWEGQPLSIIEALAFSTPVISTPHRGIPEEVIDGHNGLLIPSDDSEEIVKAVKKLVDDPEKYRKMSLAALEHFKSNFTREAHLQKLIKIICDD